MVELYEFAIELVGGLIAFLGAAVGSWAVVRYARQMRKRRLDADFGLEGAGVARGHARRGPLDRLPRPGSELRLHPEPVGRTRTARTTQTTKSG
jgi:hypothetical protein